MEIDRDDINNHNQSDRFRKLNMGKSVAVSGDPKAIPWVEKYRPQSLADVSARRDIIDTADTSTILEVARKLYGEQYRNLILDRNASYDRGINVVWQQIQDFASTQCFSFGSDFRDGGKNLTRGKNVVVSGDRKAIPWVEKYRPQSLANIAAHGDIVNTIDSLASENRLPHLLLYGPPGTGKTSTILAVAHKLYGGRYRNMILELNASDDRGIDVVRQQIQDFASTHSFSFGAKASVKLVLLDEADAMTKDAQFALRRVIEKYTKSTRFALICNHVNKIIPALQSRCTLFHFAPLDQIHVTEQLKHVISAEGLDVPEDGLAALVRLSNGDMRKALNILQSTYMASQRITEEAVYLCTGNPMPRDIEQISNWLLIESFVNSYKGISEMKAMKGLALIDIVREVTMFVFNKRPSYVRALLINDLADIEYRLCCGCNEKLQLGSLISSFTRARSAT